MFLNPLKCIFVKEFGSLKNLIFPFVLLSFYFQIGECKVCTYESNTGIITPFRCGAYEYCCGQFCCRSRSIGFFQLWYFWLLIMLMLLLCSGGGWWARYRRHYGMEPHHFQYPTAIPAPAPPPRNVTTQTTPNMPQPPPYSANGAANAAGLQVNLPPQMQHSASAQVPYPQPTYLGPPPPSYAVATGQLDNK